MQVASVQLIMAEEAGLLDRLMKMTCDVKFSS